MSRDEPGGLRGANRYGGPCVSRRSLHVDQLRLDGCAGLDMLQPIDDDPIGGRQTLGDLPQSVIPRSQLNVARDDFVFLIDDVKNSLALVGFKSPFIDQQSSMWLTDR